MMDNMKKLIALSVTLLIFIGIIFLILNVEINLGIFRIITPSTMEETYVRFNSVSLEGAKLNYQAKLTELDTNKTKYTEEKRKYDAITQETLDIIKEATVVEEFNIDYMWIKLGHYANTNNLSLVLVEPGGEQIDDSSDESTKDTITSEDFDTTITSPEGSINDLDEFSIMLVGNYSDLAKFVFDVENDVELKFKLDKINMTYADNNDVSATFVVKNLVFVK